MASRDAVRNKAGWLTQYDGVPVMRVQELPNAQPLNPADIRHCINIKGTNGSGKSTVPIYMLKTETEWCYLVASKDDKKPVATYCKTYDTVILGAYLPGTNCGGCDYLSDTQQVKFVLSRLWRKDVHILYEGVIVGDIKSTFYEIMRAFNQVHKRELGFCFMGTKYSECLRRIHRRNGGKTINEGLVKSKYRNATTQLRYYLDQGDVRCTVLKTDCTRQEVFERFLNLYPALQPVF